MLTEKDYCDYETSRELKELGFVAGLGEDDCGHCLYDESWHDQVDRPLLYDAQKWLREEKNIIIIVCPYTYNIVDETHTWTYEVWFGDNLEIEIHNFNSYEEALSEGIKEAIKLLKEEK